MATRDFSTVPATVTIKNESEEKASFRYFRVNFTEILEPADEVKLTVSSSEEVAYYAALADENIGLTVTIVGA